MLKQLLSIVIVVILGITGFVIVRLAGTFPLLTGVENIFLIFSDNIAALAISFIWLFIGIVLHELGHLIFGFATGYKFLSFRIGPLVWFKEDSQIKFSVSSSIVAGQCLMLPVKDLVHFKYILYNLGGIILNFSICVILAFLLLADINMGVAFLYIGILVNFLLGLLSLVPVKNLTNDAVNVLETRKSKDAVRGFHLMLHINAELAEGKRYRDFSHDLFKLDSNADLNNFMTAYILLLEASRLEDLGEYEESFKILHKIDMYKLPNIYRYMIKLDIMYHYILYNPDFEKAAKIFENKDIQKILSTKHPGFMRISAAYEALVNKNFKKGEALLEKAKKIANKLPNKGQRLMETEYLYTLGALIHEEQHNQR